MSDCLELCCTPSPKLFKITIPLTAPEPAVGTRPVGSLHPVNVKNVYHLHQHQHHHHVHADAIPSGKPLSGVADALPPSRAEFQAKAETVAGSVRNTDHQADSLDTSPETSEPDGLGEPPSPQSSKLPFGLGADDNWEAMQLNHSEVHRINELLKMGEDRSIRGLEAGGDEAETEPTEDGSEENQAPEPKRQDNLQSLPHEPVRYVVMLLHETQPLSYIAALIRAEHISSVPGMHQRIVENETDEHRRAHETEQEAQERRQVEDRKRKDSLRSWADDGSPAISFLTRASAGRRWSLATDVGEFIRDAARVGSFIIRIGERSVQVKVPSFEDRTRRLRAQLYATTEQIQKLTRTKQECDQLAFRDVHRLSWTGMGVLLTWWVSVTYFTFYTELGWDSMEPVTYLTGLATVMAGYAWVLNHNREVSYRAVLNETVSRRQQRLYQRHGLDIDQYQELINQAKSLRRTVKMIASEYYDLEWNQSETRAGQTTLDALNVIRQTESRDRLLAARQEEATAAAVALASGDGDGDGDGNSDGKLKGAEQSDPTEGTRDVEGKDDEDEAIADTNSLEESGARPRTPSAKARSS